MGELGQRLGELAYMLGGIAILFLHFKGSLTRYVYVVSLFVSSVASLVVTVSLAREEVPLSSIAIFLLFYAAVLFVVLSELLVAKFAERLTRTRGEKWLKEVDYIYLLLGIIGIVGSLNRVPFLKGRVEVTELIAPLFLMTAVVLRVIKTRAEIGGWNKLERWTKTSS